MLTNSGPAAAGGPQGGKRGMPAWARGGYVSDNASWVTPEACRWGTIVTRRASKFIGEKNTQQLSSFSAGVYLRVGVR